MKAQPVPVFKIQTATGRAVCRGPECPQNVAHVTKTGKIVKDTTCAVVSVQTSLTPGCLYQYFYCRDCIDWLRNEAKKNFDPNMWVFH